MRHFIFFIALTLSFTAWAQDALYDLSEDGRQNVLQNNGTFARVNAQSLLSQVPDINQVYITQVGENNVAITNVISSKSTVIIDQEGQDNTVLNFYSAGTINAEIIQRGLGNTFFETVVGGPLEEVNSINSQIGNNLTLNRIGSNSISNNISINMTGNNKTISMFSF